MRRANELVSCWMRRAGMIVREDGIGNLIGNYRARAPGSKMNKDKPSILLLGSHLDTVRDAGRFDGSLGVLVAIACVQQLHARQIRLPFAVNLFWRRLWMALSHPLALVSPAALSVRYCVGKGGAKQA